MMGLKTRVLQDVGKLSDFMNEVCNSVVNLLAWHSLSVIVL